MRVMHIFLGCLFTHLTCHLTPQTQASLFDYLFMLFMHPFKATHPCTSLQFSIYMPHEPSHNHTPMHVFSVVFHVLNAPFHSYMHTGFFGLPCATCVISQPCSHMHLFSYHLMHFTRPLTTTHGFLDVFSMPSLTCAS